MHEATAIFIHNADFHGVGKMVEDIPSTTFNVTTFHAPTEGRVAVVKLKKTFKKLYFDLFLNPYFLCFIGKV